MNTYQHSLHTHFRDSILSVAICLLIIAPSFLMACQDYPSPMSKLVEDDGINFPMHEDRVGEIVFTEGLLSLEDMTSESLSESHRIAEESNLAMTAFLETSLLNYLHNLDESLSSEELAERGNYQFSFFVDDELVYQESLNSGAGSFEQKSRQTVLRAPLASTQGEDFWSRYMWMRFFMREGGEQALKNGEHLLRIEMRPYLSGEEMLLGDVMAAGEITLSLPPPREVSASEMAVQSIAPLEDWEISERSFDTAKIQELNKLILQNEFKQIHGIVMIDNGQLLLEQYFNDEERSSLHNPRSVGKTFASTVAGIAIEEGHLKSTSQTLKEFYTLQDYDNFSSEKEEVTIRSLLTMSSGFDGTDSDMNSPGNEEYMYPTEDWVKFTLDLGMDEKKEIEKNWDYFTAGVVVLGDILEKTVPGGLEAYADAKLFGPLGISEKQWQYTPQGVANTAGGLQLRALDFAKFGQLYKNGGIWNGQQVISKSWVDESLHNYFPNDDQTEGYGYLFWRQEFNVDGQSHEAYLCNGNGGNKIIVFTDLPLVIVVTAAAYGMPYAHPQVDRILEDYLLPAYLD